MKPNADDIYKQVDSYSILIVSKYFQTTQDFINIMCVCKKFKETTEKLRFNPIPITSIKLFPKIQTQYLYSTKDIKIKGIDNYEIWYFVNFEQYLKFKEERIKCHNINYTRENRIKHGNIIPICITMLGTSCFTNCPLMSITLPSSLNSLCDNCFNNCWTLSSINFPTTLTSLGNSCFGGCTSFASITLPDSLQVLEFGCFFGCDSLTTINLPNSLRYIGDLCFKKCTSLTSITIPSTLTSLGEKCFAECYSLQTIHLPYSLVSLSNYCFRNCISLTSINLPSSLTEFNLRCFYGCDQLKSHQTIPDYCF
ncbi:hypothetical protein QTN25_004588 [Entamoeba marina]